MKKITLQITMMLLAGACSTSSVKEKINKAGDVAGQAAGEFIEGASKGVAKAFDVNVSLPGNLSGKGLQFGKATVSNDTVGTDNLLTQYVILNQDFEGKLTAKVFDEQGLEMGRATAYITGKKDETRFVDFHFDKRTNIDSKNKITIE